MQDTPLSDIRIGQVSSHWAEAQKIPTQYFETTDSTNAQAKKEAFTEKAFSEHLIVYFADQQSAGRGRGQNTWSNAPLGSQLLSTWSFLVEEPPLPVLSPLLGLSMYRAALSTWPFLDWNLKAPNDLYIGDKKAAGLLIETVSQGADLRLLIGLGFNVIASPATVATSTSLVKELPVHAPLLAQDWISFLERLIFEFSLALQMSYEELNTTVQASLLSTLNKHPLLKETYTAIDGHANLKTLNREISWSDL